jgi:hypothetical protein
MCTGMTPNDNEGRTPHVLTVKDVPVDGFWSVSVYNAKGFFQKNPQDAYSTNNLTADKNPDGSVTIDFGGKKGQPRKAILDGTWKFPEATALKR